MKNYILKRDMVVVKGSERKYYKKGEVVNLSYEEKQRYEPLGFIQEEPSTVKEIKKVLDDMGIEYPYDAKKAELQDILGATMNDMD